VSSEGTEHFRVLWTFTTNGKIQNQNVSITPDCRRIVVGSHDEHVYLLDEDGLQLWKRNFEDEVWSVAISADGSCVVAGTGWREHRIWIMDTQTGRSISYYSAGNWVNALAITPDARLIAGASSDHSIYLLDQQGSLVWSYKTEGRVRSVALSADGRILAAASWDGNIYYLREGNVIWKATIGNRATAVSMTQDGARVFAVNDSDGRLQVLDDTGQVLSVHYVAPQNASCATTAHGLYTVVGSFGRNRAQIVGRTGQVIWEFVPDAPVYCLDITPDGRYVIAGAGQTAYLLENLLPLDASAELVVKEGLFSGSIASAQIRVLV
jgi:WD40 repeat protein